jgi:hypothetical protein
VAWAVRMARALREWERYPEEGGGDPPGGQTPRGRRVAGYVRGRIVELGRV